MANTAPAIHEVQAKALEILSASATLQAWGIVPFAEDGTQADNFRGLVATLGVAVAVLPPMSARLRDQSGPRWVAEVEVVVKVGCNPKAVREGTVQSAIRVASQVMSDLCVGTRHPGGEFFRLKGGEACLALSNFDAGSWVYDVYLTKEAVC